MGNFHQTRKVPVRKNRDEATHSGKSSIPNREIYEANNKITSKPRLQNLKTNQENIFLKKREWYGCICICYIRIDTMNIYN